MAKRRITRLGEFDIELLEIEREPLGPFDVDDDYRVNFEITREGNSFTASVWIAVGSVPTIDLIRHAMGLLHLVFTQLAEQTAGWELERG